MSLLRLITHLLLTCTFYLTPFCFGEEEPDLTTISDHPTALIGGKVNAITGSFQIHACDIVVAGPEPLVLTRSYSSGGRRNGALCRGWHLNHQGKIHSDTSKEWPYCQDKTFTGPSGELLIFRYGALEQSMYDNGICNTSLGEMSARTNLRNAILKRDKKDEYCLKTPYGSKMRFKEYEKFFYLLYEHTLPSQYHYEYEWNRHSLKKVAYVNPNGEDVAQIDIKPNAFGTRILCKASDGRAVNYTCTSQRDSKDCAFMYLSKVTRCDNSIEKFSYKSSKGTYKALLVKHELPEGRYTKIQYYKLGSNHINNRNEILKEEDQRMDRVCFLYAPIGSDDSPHMQYSFFYNVYAKKDNMNWTEVRDAHNNLTEYFYDDSKRLRNIREFTKGDVFYAQHVLEWADGKEDKGNLLSRCYKDTTGQPLYAIKYIYDDNGNVLEEKTYGNFTGEKNIPVKLEHNVGIPEDKGCDVYTKSYSYNKEEFHLVESWQDSNKAVSLQYKPGTDLVIAKYTWLRNDIAQREFFEYDDNHVLIRTMVDNGIRFPKEDLAGVTQRWIKIYKPRKTAPYGLSEEVQEKYLDLDTQQEVLLRRIVNKHTKEGFLKSQTHYDSNDNLAYTLSWTYDQLGRVIKETNPLNEPTYKFYDQNGNLYFRFCLSQGYFSKYFYDKANRLIVEKEYHGDDTITAISHTYDLLGNKTSTTDRYGNTTEYIYDEFGRIIKTRACPVANEHGELITPEISKSYNILGHVVTETDSEGNITRYERNLRGQPIKIEYVDGTSEKFVYRMDGEVLKHTLINGMTVLYQRDWKGRVTQQETYSLQGDLLETKSATYNSFHLLTETDAAGVVTTYTYDGAGRKISIRKGVERTDYQYDTLGRLHKVLSFFGDGDSDYSLKSYTYDLLDRVVEEHSLAADEATPLLSVKYIYDEAGRKTHVITNNHAGQSPSETKYNTRGEVIEVLDPLQNVTHFTYDHQHKDEFGKQVLLQATTDPLGIITYTLYDTHGRVAKIYKTNTMGIEFACQEYRYNANGKRVLTIESVYILEECFPSLSHTIMTSYAFDKMGRCIKTIKALGTTEQQIYGLRYNEWGQKEALIKPDGIEIQYNYDVAGRLNLYTASDNSFSYQYSYDVKGRLIEVYDKIQNKFTKRAYDQNDHLIEETLANDLTVNLKYDPLGRVTELDLPDNVKVKYGYDSLFLRTVSRLDANGKNLYTHGYEDYDLSGQYRKSKSICKGMEQVYTYDLCGRVIQNQFRGGWQEREIKFDTVGRMIAKTVEDPLKEIESRYQYDDLSQLRSETGPVLNNYTYDSLNNRVKDNGGGYYYNRLHQLLQRSEEAYEYDLSGNLVKKKENSGHTVHYGYDALNRLTSITNGKQKTTYFYDSFNRRLSKVTEKAREEYLYVGNNEIGALTAEHEYIQLRVLGKGRGAEIGAAIALELNGEVYAPVHDVQGNVAMLLDVKTGGVAEFYRYSAFGEESIFSEMEVKNPWRYASKRYDEETKTFFFGRRSYNPKIGRWTTPDPIGEYGGPNPYAYVNNTPMTAFDCYGLEREGSPNMFDQQRDRQYERTRQDKQDRLRDERERRDGHQSPRYGMGDLFKDTRAFVGGTIETLAFNLIPIPIVKDAIEFVGHLLAGKPICEFVPGWSGPRSGLYVEEGEGKGIVSTGTGWNTTYEESKNEALEIQAELKGKTVYRQYTRDHGLALHALDFILVCCGVDTHSIIAFQQGTEYLTNLSIALDEMVTAKYHSYAGFLKGQVTLSAEQRNRFDITTIGSPTMLGEGSGHNVINYVNNKDYVTYFGRLKAWITGSNRNVVTLESDRLFFDHGSQGSTYRRVHDEWTDEINSR